MSVPRWLKVLKDALAVSDNKGKVVYQVATVDSQNIPHVRTQVNRGFIIPKSAPHLPLLVTSSDVRAPKIVQMLSNSTVEVCWWMEGSQDQFRMISRVCVIPPPDDALKNVALESKGPSVSALDEAGEDREEGGDCRGTDGKYNWEQKRKEVFEDMKPKMKASWCAPVAPGAPISSYDTPSKWPREVPNRKDLKTEEEKKNYEIALSNFAMVLFEPFQVDWIQLGEEPNRRTLFIRKDIGEVTKWEERIVAP